MRLEGPKIEAKGRERGWGSWGGAAAPSPPATGSGGAQRFSTILSTQMASPKTNIVIIVGQKNEKMKNSYPIQP